MNYTQAQIDRANAVSLEDFLRTQGETLIKRCHIPTSFLSLAGQCQGIAEPDQTGGVAYGNPCIGVAGLERRQSD